MDDKFCSNFADSDGFDLIDIDFAFDGLMDRKLLLVPLRL